MSVQIRCHFNIGLTALVRAVYIYWILVLYHVDGMTLLPLFVAVSPGAESLQASSNLAPDVAVAPLLSSRPFSSLSYPHNECSPQRATLVEVLVSSDLTVLNKPGFLLQARLTFFIFFIPVLTNFCPQFTLLPPDVCLVLSISLCPVHHDSCLF